MLYALIPLGSSARGRPSQEFQRCLHCQQDYQACEYHHVRYCYRLLSLRRAPWTSGERTSRAGALPSRNPSSDIYCPKFSYRYNMMYSLLCYLFSFLLSLLRIYELASRCSVYWRGYHQPLQVLYDQQLPSHQGIRPRTRAEIESKYPAKIYIDNNGA